MPMPSTSAQIKEAAARLGFTQTGICPAVTWTGIARFAEWLDAGYAGQMHYLGNRREAYVHPRHVLDGAKSLIMLATNYHSVAKLSPRAGQGSVARYAWGTDYHDVLHERLARLVATAQDLLPGARARGIVDTAPLNEREFAQLAGLGWIGKNTLLLNRGLGSYFFLSCVLIDQELEYDAPANDDHCGSCTACLDACPTGAFPAPRVLDGRRCISYLTIELRESIPAELRAGLGDWLFGCDICQEVCPWNEKGARTLDAAFQPRPDSNPVELTELFELSDEAFRARFRDTPLWRSKRRGILRNAALVLGNQRKANAIPALRQGLYDAEPLVREASAWALGRMDAPVARDALEARLAVETDSAVLAELRAALVGAATS